MTYQAQVVKPKYKKLEGSDNLLVVDIGGYQVLTNKECNQDELKIFFPSGGKLNQDLLAKTNSFRQKYGLNADPTATGFFEDDCRIKSIRMRGTKSEGYMLPLSTLELLNVDVSKYKIDDLLDVIEDRSGNKIELCSKYIPPAWLTKDGKVKSLSPLQLSPLLVDFPAHYDTLQLRQNIRKIPEMAKVWMSVKEHGTSARTGLVKYKAELSWWKKLFYKLLPSFNKPVYKVVTGTRNTILKIGFEADDKFEYYRVWAHHLLTPFLTQDMIIYYEIVGYNVKVKEQTNPAPLFTHSVPKEEKELRKKYGDKVEYLYGCTPESPNKILIYRIVTDHEWQPQEIMDYVNSFNNPLISAQWQLIVPMYCNSEGQRQALITYIENFLRQQHEYNHPIEGVCLRVEAPNVAPEMSTFKWKSFEFSLLEDIAYSNPNYQDIEVV